MNLLEKFEQFVNHFLWKLGELLYKLVPAPLKRFFSWVDSKYSLFLNRLQLLPEQIKTLALSAYAFIRLKLSSGIDFKKALLDSITAAKSKYQIRSDGSFSKLKLLILTPMGIVSQWLQGLSAGQSMLLLGFTAASFLAGMNMIFSGQRMMNSLDSRSPASVESEESEFSRPDYYKKEKRHLAFNSLRIPVYVAKVNQLKSVDVDFNVTFSTRESRKIMGKREFQLRDHLLLNLEPSIADFPLREEGKEILRRKLAIEINNYLKENEINGHVVNVEITYMLAN